MRRSPPPPPTTDPTIIAVLSFVWANAVDTRAATTQRRPIRIPFMMGIREEEVELANATAILDLNG